MSVFSMEITSCKSLDFLLILCYTTLSTFIIMSKKFYNQQLKAQRLSPLVVSHVKELLSPIDTNNERSAFTVRINTNADPESRDYRAFWNYQSRFTLEFVKALESLIPQGLRLVEYDHLNNKLSLERV